MEKAEWMKKAAQSILDADEEVAVEVAKQSLDDGMNPLK